MIDFLYRKIWYHFQGLFVKSKSLRRPFTYWMRDVRYRWPYLFWPVTAGVFYGMFRLSQWNLIIGFLLGGFCWMLLGHLFWGTPYIPNQQEDPPYIEDD